MYNAIFYVHRAVKGYGSALAIKKVLSYFVRKYFRTFVLSKYFRTFVRRYESTRTFESIIFVLSYMYCTRTTSTKVCAFVRVKNPKGHAAAFEWTGDASGGIPQMRFK